MATIDGFFELPTKARKDPLGPGSFNALLANADLLTQLVGKEHLLTNTNGAYGEHNAQEIPRVASVVQYSAGYTLQGSAAYLSLSGGAGVYNPAVGTLILTATSGKLTASRTAVQVQNMSESGLTKPCVTGVRVASATSLEFYSAYLSSALGAGNTWAAEDTSFAMTAQSDPVADGQFSTLLTSSAQRDIGLRADALWDPLVQRQGDLLYTFDQFHNQPTGTHADKRIPKAVGHLEYSSGAYRVVSASHNNGIGTITTVGTGICRVGFSGTLTSPSYAFVMPDFARNNSGAAGDTYIACVPQSTAGTTSIEVYLYKYDFAADTWARGDTDFWLVIHDGS